MEGGERRVGCGHCVAKLINFCGIARNEAPRAHRASTREQRGDFHAITHLSIPVCAFIMAHASASTLHAAGTRARPLYATLCAHPLACVPAVGWCPCVCLTTRAQGDKGGEAEDGERTIEAQDDHLFLDVWSIKQGALRLQTLPAAVLLLAFLGLYLCIGGMFDIYLLYLRMYAHACMHACMYPTSSQPSLGCWCWQRNL